MIGRGIPTDQCRANTEAVREFEWHYTRARRRLHDPFVSLYRRLSLTENVAQYQRLGSYVLRVGAGRRVLARRESAAKKPDRRAIPRMNCRSNRNAGCPRPGDPAGLARSPATAPNTCTAGQRASLDEDLLTLHLITTSLRK